MKFMKHETLIDSHQFNRLIVDKIPSGLIADHNVHDVRIIDVNFYSLNCHQKCVLLKNETICYENVYCLFSTYFTFLYRN